MKRQTEKSELNLTVVIFPVLLMYLSNLINWAKSIVSLVEAPCHAQLHE